MCYRHQCSSSSSGPFFFPQDVVPICRLPCKHPRKGALGLGELLCSEMVLGDVVGVKCKVPSQSLSAKWWVILERGK